MPFGEGIQMSDQSLKCLLCADDVVLIEESEEALQKAVYRFSKVCSV